MASVIPENKKRTIADMKPYFNAVMVAWIDSLHLDEHKPLKWELSRGIEHDPEKEVESEYACWKPGIDLTITINDDEKEYTHTFLKTEDGWEEKITTIETQNNTQASDTHPESDRCGIIRIGTKMMQHLMPEISIDNIDTQGHLRDTGVFARLHTRLLLPASYTVHNVFYEHVRHVWDVIIESADLPDANEFTWNDIELPHIEPIYCRESDGTVSLVELRVQAQRIIPVTGGIDALLRAL